MSVRRLYFVVITGFVSLKSAQDKIANITIDVFWLTLYKALVAFSLNVYKIFLMSATFSFKLLNSFFKFIISRTLFTSMSDFVTSA